MAQDDVVKGGRKNHQIYAMIVSELAYDEEITMACISILAYALVNINRVVGRTEIMKRFKIGKQTYYDSIDTLVRKGYCVKVDSINYTKGTFGFSSVGHIFYKYPINSLKWLEEYGTDSDNEFATKLLFAQLENTNLSPEQVSSIKDTIVGSIKDTRGSNETHYSGFNQTHIINSKELRHRKDISPSGDDLASIAKSDTDACTLQQEISISHPNLENNTKPNAKKNTKVTRGRAGAEPSQDALNFAEWFSKQTPMKGVTEGVRQKWAETYDKLILAGYVKNDVADMCLWALKDDFWKMNFMSATKLVSKNREDVPYHEIFMVRVKEKRQLEQKNKPIYNGQSYNPTGAHLSQ